MGAQGQIHWGRAFIGGFLAEVAIILVVVPIFLLFGERALLYAVPPVCLVLTFVFGMWVARRIESRFVLHGVLVGVVATLLYVALTRAQPEPPAYIVAHGLKILGGAAGGFVVERRKRAMTADAHRVRAV